MLETPDRTLLPSRPARVPRPDDEKLDLWRSIPFFLVHLACLLVLWTGVSWVALLVCVATCALRMFAITGGYHRYFSHRSYKTGRLFQFVLGFLGAASVQKGPLWWAAHHRDHHRYSDSEQDVHSPIVRGLWWAHVGWILCGKYEETKQRNVRDFARFPELHFLNRFHLLPVVALAVTLLVVGTVLNKYVPQLHTSGWQLLAWGFFVSTVLLYHATFSINSLAHLIGRKRFVTGDESRNSLLLALITMGEGWHNNHHRYPASERQGFYWWEIDVSHYILKTLSWFGIVWDLAKPPRQIYAEAGNGEEHFS